MTPDTIALVAPFCALVTVLGGIYTAVVSNRLNAAKQDFDKDKERRGAIVADIERCENRLDELQALVKKWMGDYDELHTKHLAECTAHGETKLALANCERKIAGLETTLESITRDRDQKIAQVDMLQKMIIDKELKDQR